MNDEESMRAFDAWYEKHGPFDGIGLHRATWCAAVKWATGRCVEVIDAFAVVGDRSEQMLDVILEREEL